MTEADTSRTGAREAGAVDRIEQIRRAHAHARPTHLNPAWQNSHADLGFALQYIDTLRAQLEAAEALAAENEGVFKVWRRRAEAAEADAARWRTWRALDEHSAAEIAWFAGGPEDRDAEIDARTKEAAP